MIAEELELKNQVAKVFMNIGRCNYEKGNLNEALVYYNKCHLIIKLEVVV